MEKKRVSIRRQIERIVLLSATVGLLLTSIVGLSRMLKIRNLSEAALEGQVEINLTNTIADKAALADAKFGKYEEFLQNYVRILEEYYDHPEDFVPQEVLPPDAKNQDHLTMQRYLRDENVSLDDPRVQDEIAYFGNLEPMWRSLNELNIGVIATMYLGTESGVMVSYDRDSALGVPESGTESYFDYSESDWYVKARDTSRSGFTDLYADSYGRGIMVTAYAPFYNGDDFAGAVCIDMLISDIYESIVSIDLGDGGEVFLIDNQGSTVDMNDKNKLVNISDIVSDQKVIGSVRQQRNGFTLTGDGRFYVYAVVESTGWMLTISIPQATVLASVYEMNSNIGRAMLIFIIGFLIIIIAVSILAVKFSKKLTKPLEELGKDAQIISGGDLDHRAYAYHNDEIGDLANRFNDMAGSLKTYIKELTTVTAEKERIGAELNVATQIQADMLPRIFPAFPDRDEFDIYATMDPAKEVGGDFYDYFLIDDDHIALVMADVSGKGVPAALFMVIAKTLIKNHALMGCYSPAEILKSANEQLCEGNEAELFVTVWMAIIQISTGKGLAANAGHEHPVIKRAGGQYELVEYRHSPAVATMEGIRFREHEFQIYPGDSLYVYTDGVPEATNAENVLFGPERMLEALNSNPDATPQELLRNVRRDIDIFVGRAPQFDDITMLNFLYNGPQKNDEHDELKLDATLENLDEVLAFIDSRLEEAGCPPKVQMQIDIAVEELFVNIAHYAYTPNVGSAIVRITPNVEEKYVDITFIDEGMPYDPLAKADPDITLSADKRPIGGLGIYMVKKSMDNMLYKHEDGKNQLTIRKYFQ